MTTRKHSTDSPPSWLAELNADQRRTVTFDGKHVLVVAGAGSGKTRVLTHRTAYLIHRGVDPERILLLTFTRRASQEMLKRAAGITEQSTKAAGRVWGGTFHAIANRLLRIYAKAARLDPNFTVMDQADAQDLMHVLRHELGYDKLEKRFPRKTTCLAVYSRCMNSFDDLAEVLERHYPWCADWKKEFKKLFKVYTERKQKLNVLDYDDLLVYWMELMLDKRLGKQIGRKFGHVLVDEYQDTNRVQAMILKGFAEAGCKVMAVGDDAQSIYSFRAAAVENMLEFPEQFPGTKVIKLEQNYRSLTPILETTNKVIAQAKNRYTKELWSERKGGDLPKLVTCFDEDQQGEYVADRVLEHHEQGIPLRQQAVLFRAGWMSAALEVELTRRNIPFHKYGGIKFVEAAHIKDLVGFLRILENARDEMAWFRLLELLPGVGPGTASKVFAHVADHGFDPKSISSYKSPKAAREGMDGLAKMLEQLADGKTRPPAAEVQRIRQYYEPLMEKKYDNTQPRSRDLDALEQIATGYKSRRQFLVDLSLDPPSSTSDLAEAGDKEDDFLVLSTIHSAKGLEWDCVYLIHATDGCLPSDLAAGSEEEIEEELRLSPS